MPSSSNSAIRFLYLFLLAPVLVMGALFSSIDQSKAETASGTFKVEVGQGILIPNTGTVEAIFVSDPEVADIKDSPEEAVFLFGKSVGKTSLIATDLKGKELFRYTVVVSHQISEIQMMISERFPKEKISVRSSRGSIFVSGDVSNQRVREDLFASLNAAVPETKIIDETTVISSNIVRLDVKLLEVNKSEAERHGIDINALIEANGFALGVENRGQITGGFNSDNTNQAFNARLSATLDLLISNQVATIVTETSLSAVSGKEATFEVGGEIPIPTFVTDGNIRDFSLTYKFVGLLLQFTPLRLEENKVYLNIASSITNTAPSSVSVNGNAFPNLNTRRFKTDVELSDQQSFLIAGLSRQSSLASLREPKKGNVVSRGLAGIFGGNRVQNDSRELVIVVTPHFRPADRKLVSPKAVRSVSNLEYLVGRKTKRKDVVIHGSAGFMY